MLIKMKFIKILYKEKEAILKILLLYFSYNEFNFLEHSSQTNLFL